MIDLNNPSTFKHLDPKDVYGSTGLFADQCQQMVDEYWDFDFYGDLDYKNVRNIVFAGMGGSSYGAHIVHSLYLADLKFPWVTVNDYHLPGFVDEKTLVFTTSYSGSTEEVLSCANEAIKKGAKLTGFSAGGKLGEILKGGYPGFTFNPKNNPSGQPRLGTGYMLMGTLILLNQLGIISLSKVEIETAIKEVRSSHEEIKLEAQKIAKQIQGYIPLIFASQHLVGNAHILRNQLNETSKTISIFEDIPELNHHLMEGLKYPNDKKLKVLFLESVLYSPMHSKRVRLTQDVISKNQIEFISFQPQGSTKISQVLNTLSFGGYITFYLGVLYGEDPSLIPWVDYFKEQLAKKG